MARKSVELLLNRTVENLGIVGDVVKVKPGFARNYLLPHQIAEHPTPEKIEALKEARAKAQAELAKLRSEREALVARMEGLTIKLIRSCNDQGALYGAVSQRDIADQLVAEGYGVDTRAVRLSNPIRRIGSYHCLIQFDRDLRADVTIDVLPDRAIEAFTAATAETEAEAPAVEETPAPQEDAAAESKGAKGAKAAKGGKAGKDAAEAAGAEDGVKSAKTRKPKA
ncbi:MAG: 50S ribosomal protein L9 [Phycisphaerales bacterium]